MQEGGVEDRVFEVRVVDDPDVYRVRSGERVLLEVERDPRGTPIQVGCRGGGCGVCRVRVVSGEYRVGRMSRAHVSEADEAAGYALACRLYPLSDLVLERAARGIPDRFKV